jgi:hypothetical protein
MTMKKTAHLIITVATLLCGLLAASGYPRLLAATPLMPVTDVKPGMLGIGHTVFNGSRVEQFNVRILGVMSNAMGPQRNLILAKLEGGPLAQTGVIAGMSGSPVYIDGRLIGAVSYALGSFSREPIAGITPIDEMTADTAGVRPAMQRVSLEVPITNDALATSFRKALSWNRPFADRVEDTRFEGSSPVSGLSTGQLGTLLRPIATPLVMSGFTPGITDLLSSAFRDHGFVPMAAGVGSPTADMVFDGPLKPGDAVGVNFVRGDFLLGGTGTVTHIDGDRVYAFGHPMYNIGPTEFPMTRAYVYTLLPSLASSSKLTTTADVIGTFLHDRPTTIAGRLGPGPKMIPVTLTLKSDHAPARTFKFDVVRDQLFTPLMTQTTLLNVLVSYEREFGAATFAVQGSMQIGKYGSVSINNIFAGDGAGGQASAAIIQPLNSVLSNDHERVEVEKLDVTIDTVEELRTATLERVWIDDPRPRAGRTVPLKVLLRQHRGEEIIRTVPIDIPVNARGNLTIVVADGNRLAQADVAEARQLPPRTMPQLLRALNQGRRNNTLYIRLQSAEPGAIVRGERMAALPPSVLAVVESDRNSGASAALTSATLGEWTVSTDRAVSGIRTLTMAVATN